VNFSFNNSISFGSDGSLIIKNGSQTIKMGGGGMVIDNNGGQQQIMMNNNGIQIMNQQTYYTNYPGQNFHMQTNFSTNHQNYGNQYYEEDSSEEMSSQESSYEDSGSYYHEEDPQNQNQSYYYQAPGMNMGWQINHQMTFPPQNVYYYNTPQTAQMPQEEPRKKGLTRSQLNQLPVSTYNVKAPKTRQSKSKTSNKQGSNNKDDSSNVESCTICIADYKQGDKIKTLPCMHKFHKDCIDKWLGLKSECPMCKYDLLE